jgi:hypothetical protein
MNMSDNRDDTMSRLMTLHGGLHHLKKKYLISMKMMSPMNHGGSQSAFGALGGYTFPSTSTFGSQVHLSSSGIESITIGICWPQPHHDDFSREVLIVCLGNNE